MVYRYRRRANYYETDMMGIVHHSNYLRFFEEARIAFMRHLGCDVMQMEREGIIIPNVDAYARYYVPVRFDEEVDVEVCLRQFTGARMEFAYRIINAEGALAAEGHTTHCFVRSNFKPISLRLTYPEYCRRLSEALCS